MKFVDNKSVIMSDSVRNFINSYSSECLPNETGGILLGFNDQNNIYITHATKAGEKAIHSPFKFMRDYRFSKQELDNIFVKTEGQCDYIGEWHSHPSNRSISLLDMFSLLSLTLNPFNNINQPILLINVNDGENWRKDIFVYDNLKLCKLKNK